MTEGARVAMKAAGAMRVACAAARAAVTGDYGRSGGAQRSSASTVSESLNPQFTGGPGGEEGAQKAAAAGEDAVRCEIGHEQGRWLARGNVDS